MEDAERLSDSPPLWAAGLVVISLTLGWWGLGLSGEERDWATYHLLGSVVPAGAVVLGVWRSGVLLRRALAIGGLVGTVALLWSRLTVDLAAMAVFTWLVWEAFSGRLLRPAPLHLLVIAIAWCALSTAAYWRPAGYLVAGSLYQCVLTASAVVVCAAGLAHTAPAGGRLASRVRALTACVVFVISSVRASPIAYSPTMHHWGAIVGPAELVRQGGWLLWDVPSQYGFLSTLTIAVMPVGTVWQSFYVLNALLHFIAGCILFFVLRGPRADAAGDVLAFVVAEAAVFLVPGFLRYASGPWFVPNVGAFRFVWCYVLIALLVRLHRHERGGPALVLGVGCLVWLLATLWSAESGVYAAIIWLPAFAGVVSRRFRSDPLRAAACLALPAGLLLTSGAILEALYRVRLGHGPDWWAFVEYVIAFRTGTGLPADPGGAALILVLALWAIASTGGEMLRQGAPAAALALAWGAWATAFSTASYFVLRSDDSNATNLIPLACAGLAAALALLRAHGRRGVTAIVSAALVPLFATVPALALAEPSELRRVAGELLRGYVSDVDGLLPERPSVQEVISQAGLTTEDAIAYVDTSQHLNPLPPVLLASPGGPQRVTMPRAWLPMPLILLVPLPEARARVYLKRSSLRVGSGGWLLEPRHQPAARWLTRWLDATHRRGRSLESGVWRLTEFEPVRLRP